MGVDYIYLGLLLAQLYSFCDFMYPVGHVCFAWFHLLLHGPNSRLLLVGFRAVGLIG